MFYTDSWCSSNQWYAPQAQARFWEVTIREGQLATRFGTVSTCAACPRRLSV